MHNKLIQKSSAINLKSRVEVSMTVREKSEA